MKKSFNFFKKVERDHTDTKIAQSHCPMMDIPPL